MSWLARLSHEVRLAARFLAHRPRFVVPAVVSLALAIGATTAIYSIVHAVFLKPIPVEQPDRLIGIYGGSADPARADRFLPTSLPNLRDYEEQAKSVDDILAFVRTQLSLTGGDEAVRVAARLTTPNYFSVLGTPPQLGRGFEDQEEGAAVVVISHQLWQRQFGGDTVIGSKIELDGVPFTIIGVTPRGFRGASNMGSPEMWIPLWMHPQIYSRTQLIEQRAAKLFTAVGRLAPGATVGQATAELETIGVNLAEAYPDENRDHRVKVRGIAETTFNPNMIDQYRRASTVLLIAVGLVLLIACANVANLLIAQAAARRKEIALRLSLGASRLSLIRQLMVESLLVALAGGALGMLLAIWGQKVIWSLRPAFMRVDSISLELDLGVLGFALLVTIATGVLFGLIPALQGSKPDLVTSLKNEDAAPSRQRGITLRKAIVVTQVALSLLALVGAGLFLRSLQKMQQIDLGYETEDLHVMTFHLGTQRYDEVRGTEHYARLLERIRAHPGVVSAGFIENAPFDPAAGFLFNVSPEGADPNADPQLIRASGVTPGYFATLGLPIARGRAFTDADRDGAPWVAIVNETLAKVLWPDRESAVGARLHLGDFEWIEVVGVAQDTKYIRLTEEPTPYLYLPAAQGYTPQMTLQARLRAGTGPDDIRRLSRELDANVPISDVSRLEDVIGDSLWMPRMGAGLLSIFGFLALVLAIVGLYAVITSSVQTRAKEIAVRMAVGAERGKVMALVLRQSLAIISVGVVIGLVLAVAGYRFLRSQLYEAEAIDPMTLVAVTLVLLGVAVLATLVPAFRATRIDPTLLLRRE